MTATERALRPRISSMEAVAITFAFSDASKGYESSPDRVALGSLREFTREVEDFLRGDDKEVDTAALTVALIPGSLGIRTEPLSAAASVMRDLRRLAGSQLVQVESERRRNIVLGWQRRARSTRRLSYRIEAAFLETALRIDASTDFHADDADQWVRVERYMRGEVVEIGGVRNTNAHIKLPNGATLQVDATREQLREDRINRLFKPAMVRFRAEFNVSSGEYRDAQLIAFAEYEPRFDAEQFERLTERGSQAWADVSDAADWVEALRGE